MSIELRKTGETDSTITFAFDPVPGAQGYRFSSSDSVKRSHTWDPARSQVRFSKGADWYRVEALGVLASGEWPPSEPEPEPEGTILVSGAYDNGIPAGWDWDQTRGYMTLGDDPVVGKRANFTLPANAPEQASEFQWTHNRVPELLGREDYIRISVRFPSGWREPSPAGWGAALCQLNYLVLAGHNLGLFAHADNVQLILLTGAITYRNNVVKDGNQVFEYNNSAELGSWPNGPRAIPEERWQLDVWHHLVMRIKWATTAVGNVAVWHRREGEPTWTKTIERLNVPTLQWGKAISYEANRLEMTVDGKYVPTGGDYTGQHKMGIYRGAASYPITVQNAKFAVATTFDAAAR